jgi:NCS1 family nucleobase:cation symporter-1
LLGPIGGILIADYFVWRGRRLDLAALYREGGEYQFRQGFSWVAIGSLVVGAFPSVPGFLVQVGWLSADKVAPGLVNLYNYAWFIGFAIAFVAYLAGRKVSPRG